MLEHYIRPRMDVYFFTPLAKVLSRTNVSPNAVTLFSLVCGLAIIPLMLFQHLLLSVFMLWFSGLLDVIDGGLARLSNRGTTLGTIFDIVSDRIVEFSVVLALFLVDPSRAFTSLMMLGSILICVTSFLVVGIVSENKGCKSFYYSPGIIERAEAFILFSLMILLPSYFFVIAWSFIILVFLTTIIRLFESRKIV